MRALAPNSVCTLSLLIAMASGPGARAQQATQQKLREAADAAVARTIEQTRNRGRAARAARGRPAPVANQETAAQHLVSLGAAGTAAIDRHLQDLWQASQPEGSTDLHNAARTLVPIVYRTPNHGVEQLGQWARHPDTTFRQYIATGLTAGNESLDAEQVPTLMDFLGDPDARVRTLVLQALGRAPLAAVANLLADPDDDVAGAALSWFATRHRVGHISIPPAAIQTLRQRVAHSVGPKLAEGLARAVQSGVFLGTEAGQQLHLDALPRLQSEENHYPSWHGFAEPDDATAWMGRLVDTARRLGPVGNSPTVNQVCLTATIEATLPFAHGAREPLLDLVDAGYGAMIRSRAPLLGAALQPLGRDDLERIAGRLPAHHHPWLGRALLEFDDYPPAAAPILEAFARSAGDEGLQQELGRRAHLSRHPTRAEGTEAIDLDALLGPEARRAPLDLVRRIEDPLLLRALAMTTHGPVVATALARSDLDEADLRATVRLAFQTPSNFGQLAGLLLDDVLPQAPVRPDYVDEVVRACRAWLGRAGNKLVPALGWPDIDSVLSLARQQDHPQTAALLRAALDTPIIEVRQAALTHCRREGLLAGDEILAGLRHVLADPKATDDVRIDACLLLGTAADAARLARTAPLQVVLRWPELAPLVPEGTLERLLQHADVRVRQGACIAAERQGDPAIIPALLDAMGDARESVRRAARTAIEQLRFRADAATWWEKHR